ncbi:MAG: hypothetical protein EOP84_33310 [Verrucomicrobiaceae bacterium]|nr:MAG: hypothetical protein EOP84_33310 [Verrucomicrobiaceae bacterium]
MKQLVTLLGVLALGLLIYKHHTGRMKAAAERAAQRAAEAAAARARMEKPARKPKKPPQLEAIALSRVLEPHYRDLFSSLDQHRPEDLVPPLEITKERILDMQTHAEPEKQVVYSRGITLLNGMIALAEERTKTLEAMLKTAAGRSSLDSPNAVSTSTSFFTQTTIKRWEEEKARHKARLDQLFTALRTAERDWNKRAGKNALVERYDLPTDSAPVLVTVDHVAPPANPLERKAYDQRRVTPWRSSYYDRYGYPQSGQYSQPYR